MTDQRIITPSGARNAFRRHLRSSSQSPSRQRRPGDDLLSRLTPATAVEALRAPTGALKSCLDQASATERLFATRTAVASQKIHEWVDELSHWPWPAEGGSAGFEMPPTKRRKLFETDISTDSSKGKLAEFSPQSDIRYFGSLPADDFHLYEKRIDQIQEELEALDLEEIKSQVLHNHILPLSRPGTPFSDAGLSVTSTMSFTKMEDLTAVVTALIMQTLPKLSRLSRLLYAWSARLLLLPKVPVLLTMLTDAEVALRSGWNVIQPLDADSKGQPGIDKGTDDSDFVVTRKDFEVMKSVLHKKIQKPGQEIDFMLDSLEGMQDTLPDEWLERLETIEEDYARWEIAAEKQVREGEWHRAHGTTKPSHVPSQPVTPGPKIQIQGPSPAKSSDLCDSSFLFPPLPVDRYSASEDVSGEDATSRHSSAEQLEKPSKYGPVKILVDEPSGNDGRSGSRVIDLTDHAAHQRDVDSGAVVKNPSLSYGSNISGKPVPTAVADEDFAESDSDLPQLSSGRSSTRSYDGTRDALADANVQGKPVLSELDRNVVRASPAQSSKPDLNALLRSTVLQESILESGDEDIEEDEEDEELNLPPIIQRARRCSQISMASTVLHGSTSHFFDQSDDVPFREGSADLELPRLPDPDEPFSSDALSPPSSPPLRYKPRSTSVTFKENPDIAPTPEGRSTPPRSPLAPPVVFDPDVSYELESQFGSPNRMNMTSDEDRHLQQQIGAILESVPLKIRLNSKASAINLNPPDFQPPTRPRPRTSDTRRPSVSSMSSRAGTPSTFSRSGTPSYMLAPARNTGPRSKSSQEIRVYHLLRSGGEAPIKLFIRTVGERNERVMVRVGGGWSDLGEYLREYALHHGRRSRGEGKVEVTDLPSVTSGHVGSSPSSRPTSAMDTPMTPLRVRKTRKSVGEDSLSRLPRTPLSYTNKQGGETPNSESSMRSRGSSKAEWDEESSSLGLAGPKPKKVEISDESKAWVESVKEKVRMASSDRTIPEYRVDNKFGEMGKVGGTKRLYRKN